MLLDTTLLTSAPVRLDAIAWPLWRQPRRDDIAMNPYLLQLPVQLVTTRAGFIHTSNFCLFPMPPLDQFLDTLAVHSCFPLCRRLPIPTSI